MKKTLIIMLGMMTFLTACGNKNAADNKVDAAPAAQEAKADDAKANDAKADDAKADDAKADDAKVDDAKVDDAKADDAKAEEKVSEADAVGKTVTNDTLVLKYTGSEKDALLGATSMYWRFKGFKENGELDRVKGKMRMLYFFADEAAYDAGVEACKAKLGCSIKEEHKVSLYFMTSSVCPNDWETFNQVVDDVTKKEIPSQMPPSPDYELVK